MVDISIIVIGALNTDIVAHGANKIIGPGEHTYARELKIGPGVKSRNIAQMIATLMTKKTVAMIGKTSKDPYGLWKIPLEALQKSGVNTEYVDVLPFELTNKFPGVALIAVDNEGRNQIYVLPGITDDFDSKDIDAAAPLFESAKRNSGILVLTLELPLATVIYAMRKATAHGLKVLLDPGGIVEGQDYTQLLKQKIFLIKPNEHEAKILTGVDVRNFSTAKQAAKELLKRGIQNVFITVGKDGGYLFSQNLEKRIPVPKVTLGKDKDETGCGDQTTAALAASLQTGADLYESAQISILAGTLQFGKPGIDPVTSAELLQYTKL